MADAEFYLNAYRGGVVPAEEWPQYQARAADQLAQYKRLYTVAAPGPDSEAMALCAMAEALYSFDLLANGQGGSAAAQAVDLTPKGQARELYRCASRYLDIYRGCG